MRFAMSRLLKRDQALVDRDEARVNCDQALANRREFSTALTTVAA